MDYSKDQCSAIIKYCKKYKTRKSRSKSKSRSRSRSIKSKSITRKSKSKINVCEKWLNNKNINPTTNRKIKTNGSVYKKLQKDCSPKSKRSPPISVKLDDDVLQFGKYKGYKIINVINKNPNYAMWLYKQQWLKKKYSNIYRILEQNIHKFTRFNRSK